MSDWQNVHATAISVGGIGLVFVGPSGSGKSSLAFDCLCEAKMLGLEARLISDDQLLVHADRDGIKGRAPDTIRGFLELRYAGIVQLPAVDEAMLHAVATLVPPDEKQRLPRENEVFQLTERIALPLLRIPAWSRNPLSLALALLKSRASFDV
ncbi:HPr kinase/phosphorylase [Peteryoungia ipomoeae]|uniref:HPr kinase/phosphorylase n=1 Tax=Peteryoungia ipomoeae TaxID=1210932 RepID=A0A4S8P3D5_9HYPH|nr:HPr kinase/phosphatase C-terminal domain-containing protein [Peteryoungia ipomoeae]THV22129.1 HPr kinase/phosphorylase [Peteryoungia ipomoeae]